MTEIDKKYNELAAAGVYLGDPLGPEMALSVAQGRYRDYQVGSIYWSPGTGAFEVHGGIRDRWLELKGAYGVLGLPLTDESAAADGAGRYNHFQYGSIYWSPSTGGFEIYGSIRDKWFSLGAEQSVLGYPTSGELGTPNGKARYNRFQYGSIYAAPTGTFEIHGHIDEKWAAMGREQSLLGYPLMDVGQAAQKGSLYTRFEHGNIYWSVASGAHEVHGMILDEYANWKWEQGCLGFPISDVEVNPTSLVAQQSRFQNGDIIIPTVGSLYTLCPRPIVQ